MARLTAVIIMVGFLATPIPSSSHVVLDPDVIQGILVQIARSHKESSEGASAEGRAEALYRLGEKVQGLVELMNQDLSCHGKSDPFVQLLLKRLEAYQIRIAFSEQEKQYAYDLAAFREYLNRLPKGKRAPEARFQLIARTFYETLGPDPSKLVKADVAGLIKATTEEEQFLKDYPLHGRSKDVQFFLAVDYYRLHKNFEDAEKTKKYERLSREALEKVTKQFPGTIEARAAEALLERLKGDSGH